MIDNFAFLDFEYNNTKEKNLNLVCCSVDLFRNNKVHEKKDFWLHGSIKAQVEFQNYIKLLVGNGVTLVAYNVIAEAGSLLSLPAPINVAHIPWIDLWLEYRNVKNHDYKIAYGKQLVKGKVTRLYEPGYKEEKDDSPDGMAACCYKLLDVLIDTDEKEEVRDIIIRADYNEVEANKDRIMKYCRSDIKYLPEIYTEILRIYKKKYKKKHFECVPEWMRTRGEYSARTAIMERDGYPINYEHTKNFSDNVSTIIYEIQGEINELFPEVTPFKHNIRKGEYSWNQKATREWIANGPFADEWPLTKGKQLSLSVDAFTKFYNFRHNYPKDNLGAQFVRYLKTGQNLRGFSTKKSKTKSLWDYVGEDGWVRPFTNIYRSQSSRSQPSSSSFMFLKAAWMRALVQPPIGKAMGGIDYGSQEFLVAALLSGDKKMIKAYLSGDVYLWFGQACKKIPKTATKKTHGKLRDRFKSSVLGIQYGMQAKSLAIKITNDTGIYCSVEEAQEFIDMFDEVFYVYSAWRDEQLHKYWMDGYLILRDGWTMWGDNKNGLSVKNCPVQGAGAAIMRRAVCLSQDRGLNIPFTLHDALYLLGASDKIVEEMDIMAECMLQAFEEYFPEHKKEFKAIRLDGSIWSLDFEDKDDYIFSPNGLEIKKQKIYVDGRGREEYEQFSKYFERNEFLDVL